MVKTPPFHGVNVGSNPAGVTIFFGRLAQLGERLPYKQDVSGSSPLSPTRLQHIQEDVLFCYMYGHDDDRRDSMRTETGVVEKILPDHMVLIKASRTSLFSRHASSIGNATAPIEVRNEIGAEKGDFVEFALPERNIALGGFIGFGIPMLIVLLSIVVLYTQGPSWGLSENGSAAAGFIGGLILAFIVMKILNKAWKGQRSEASILRIIRPDAEDMEHDGEESPQA